MDLSYQEKSILGSLIVTVGIFVYYCARVADFATGRTELTIEALWPLVLSLVLVVIIVEIVAHIIIAVVAGPEQKDERDRMIDAKASRVAYLVLGVGAFLAVFHLVLSTMLGLVYAKPLLRDFWIVNILLFSITLAEVVKFSMQLVYYRRGV